MREFDLYKMIFATLDHYWDRHQDRRLAMFLSSMNPYLFEGEGSAVPDTYLDYQKYVSGRKITVGNSYDVASGYVKYLNKPYVADAFVWASRGKWEEKCRQYLDGERGADHERNDGAVPAKL